MPKITYYKHKCIGCNACVEASHQHWRLSKKDGKSVLLFAKEKKGIYSLDILEEDLAANLKAEKNCSVNAIKINK